MFVTRTGVAASTQNPRQLRLSSGRLSLTRCRRGLVLFSSVPYRDPRFGLSRSGSVAECQVTHAGGAEPCHVVRKLPIATKASQQGGWEGKASEVRVMVQSRRFLWRQVRSHDAVDLVA